MKRFAVIGVGGYIAPRHLKAIKDTGNIVVAALDRHDSVGIMDSYFPEASFFTEFERFDRHIEKLRYNDEAIDYVTVCSPNYLHDSHIRFGLRHGAHVICEKPLVLNPWNIDALAQIEQETGRNVYTILQLRLHPAIIELRDQIQQAPPDKRFKVKLTYITSRGSWYHHSWKGDVSKSGGIATNIGVHFFDMLTWVFGDVMDNKITEHSNQTASGTLQLERADIEWYLSIDAQNLPESVQKEGKRTYRSLLIENNEIEFSDGFTELHTHSYQEILAGRGFGLDQVRKSINIVSNIRNY